MLTIRYAALAADLDMARARMDAHANEIAANAEWADLTDAQRQMFLSVAIHTEGLPHEAPPESHGPATRPESAPGRA